MNDKIRLSYVRILMVALVLGLVGKAVSPQFAGASAEKKVSMLLDGLQLMRAHLDLYRAQHGDSLPPTDSLAGFQAAMTRRAGQFGPYVDDIPANPFNGLNTVRFNGEPAGADKAGWRLDTRTGLFQADNDVAYAAL